MPSSMHRCRYLSDEAVKMFFHLYLHNGCFNGGREPHSLPMFIVINKKESNMKSIRYYFICVLTNRWNVPAGQRLFRFSKVNSIKLLTHIQDHCHTAEQVTRTLSDHMQYDAMFNRNSIESNAVFAHN